MKLKHHLIGLLLALGVTAASASALVQESLDADQYKLTYDLTETFGYLSSSFGSEGTYGFTWKFSNGASAASIGGARTKSYELPSFTLSANPGWQLAGPVSGFVGNLVFGEAGAVGTTSVVAAGTVSVDAGTPVPVAGRLSRVVLATEDDVYAVGYYQGSVSLPYGPFSTLSLSQGSLTFKIAAGGAFAGIVATDQAELTFSFNAIAAPVPEPESWALLLAGVGLVGYAARRGPASRR